mgnify:CR=1 FL=1
MYKRLTIWMVFCLLSFSFFGCVTTTTSFKDYKPASTDEKQIYATLKGMMDSREKGDVKEYMSYIHKDAKIMTGDRYRKMVSKEDYLPIIKKQFADGIKTPPVDAPKIEVSGDTAEVDMLVEIPEHPDGFVNYKSFLVRENGKWLIMRQEY